MYIKIKKDQNILINSAIKKAGSYRKLAKNLEIPKSSLVRYKQLGAIPEKRFKKIIFYLKIKEKNLSINKLEDNWREKLGGRACVKSKKEKGTFEKQLKEAQKSGIKQIKEWHKKMKKEHPKKYYIMQYEKFKKIYGYKCETNNKEKVRNKFEKDVANKLKKLGIKYEYEPFIKIKEKGFFPDFLINKKIIIEATEWQGKEKAYQLKEKIKYLEKKYVVFVVIPKHLYSKYKILDNNLIIGIHNLDLVAQLVRAHGCYKDLKSMQ